MVYEDQLMPTEVWISLPFEWAFLLFHVVVTLFIGVQLIRETKAFASAFFLFFFLLSLADIGNYWTIQYMQRIARYGLLGEWRPSSFGCTLTLFFTGFFSHLQFATHLAIAANRYTVFLQPTMHRRIWIGKWLALTVLLIFSVSFACASVRFSLDSTTKETDYGFICGMNNMNIKSVNGYVAVSFALITCALSCLLEVRTFVAFRKMNTSHRREHRDDYKLLMYAMISFVAHLLMAVQYVCTYLITPSPPFMNVAYPFIVDLLCLTGSVCLVATRAILSVGLALTVSATNGGYDADVGLPNRPRCSDRVILTVGHVHPFADGVSTYK